MTTKRDFSSTTCVPATAELASSVLRLTLNAHTLPIRMLIFCFVLFLSLCFPPTKVVYQLGP